MKTWKTHKIILFVVACVIVNFGGKFLAEEFNLPLWLDSIGTVMGAYALGPICGAIIGVGVNAMHAAFSVNSYFYAVVNLLVGLIAGFLARKGIMKRAFGAFSLGMILAVVATIVSIPFNLYYYGGMTGNLWGDGVIEYFKEFGLHPGVCYFIGEFYVDVVDKLIAVFTVFYIIKIYRNNAKIKSDKVVAALVAMLLAGSFVLGNIHTVSGEEEDGASVYDSYIQTIYNSDNGIPGGEVNDIAQTLDGTLWLGTYGGLYSYDGSKFTFMSEYDSVRNVNCLYTDEEGRLWIGTNDSGLSIAANNEIVNVVDTTKGLPADTVRSITKDSLGQYYVGTSKELCVIALTDGVQVIKVFDELRYVSDMCADARGLVCAVNSDGDLILINNSEIVASYNSVEGYTYTTVYFDRNGYLYASDNTGVIHVYSIDNNELTEVKSIDCAPFNNINSMYMVEDRELFICADNGIGYIDESGRFRQITVVGFDSSIDNILVDYQGNLWFTSSRLGLLELSMSMVDELYKRVGLSEKVVNAVTKWNGSYWFGTDTGIDIVTEDFSEIIENDISRELDKIRIRSFAVDKDNNLWIAATGLGAYRVSPEGEYEVYNTNNGLIGGKTRAFLELNDGTMLVATDAGITYIADGIPLREVGVEEGLIVSKTLCLVEYNNRVYAGTDGGGIAIIRDGQVEKILKKADGLSSDVILRMYVTANNSGIIVVTSNGLNFVGRMGEIRQLKGFPYYNNYDVIPDGNGNVWVTGSAGIYIVSEQDLVSNDTMDYELLDAQRGLRTSFTANSWNYINGDELILCGDTGAVMIDMGKYDKQHASYRIMLDRIIVDGTSVNVDKEEINHIGREVTRVEFVPKVINFSASNPYVSVWLEGFDREPLVVLQQDLESLVYTNLPSGEYVFHLAILDGKQERVLEQISYSFVKEKELYDNWWFVLYILLILAIITVYFVWLIVGSQINASLKMQRKEIENMKLKQTADAAVAAGEAKDRFLALMSHDIRTPINAILGMNEMIIRDSNEADVQNYAGDIKEAGNTLLALVNTILDFSKIEEGKMEIVPVNYESRKLFTSLIHAVGMRAQEKGLEFKIDIDKTIPKGLYGDDMRITQIISNLLTNAVKYTEKGFISLTAKVAEKDETTVALYIEVADSGIGIREEDMGKLFESFQRLDEERNRQIEGTGLGMSIVTSLLELMGSKLEVESEYGVGSKFSFVLRQTIVASEELGAEKNNAIAKPAGHVYAPSAKLLVVDDNEMNLKVAVNLLRINGIVPDTAVSGPLAIDLIKEKHYDIIYLDHMMPGMDGIETLNAIKENNLVDDSTKIIVLTANAIGGAREQYMKQGFDDYLSKPIEVDMLEMQLAKYLNIEEGGAR